MELPYAVVRFLQQANCQNYVDLVPSSWITKEKGKLYCRYPDPKDYGNISDWVSNLKKPEPTWRRFGISLFSYARTLDDGTMRFNMALRSDVTPESHSEEETDTIFQSWSIKEEDWNAASTTSASPTRETPSPCVSNKRRKTIAAEPADTEEPCDAAPTIDQHLVKLMNSELDKFAKRIMEYVDRKHKETEKLILDSRSSILTTVHEESNEIQQLCSKQAPVTMASLARQNLNATLPIKSIETFLEFEESLKSSSDKRTTLMSLYRTLCACQSSVKNAIARLMSTTVAKAVEIEYSGTGKKIRGVSKRNFSETETYSCLHDALLERFGDTEDLATLPGKVGRWLSAARDREGGRKDRPYWYKAQTDN